MRLSLPFFCFLRGWPETDSGVTLIRDSCQCLLTGKAQEAFAALLIVDSDNYDKIKSAVLKAYEFVPEAYRQKFRSAKKQVIETYAPFFSLIDYSFWSLAVSL